MWSAVAQSAFDQLKVLFSSAPVLVHPNPELQFVMEVDASDSGVGALPALSLRPKTVSMHLFLSASHSGGGNRELLVVMLAVQEWQHWLEGAVHPFTVQITKICVISVVPIN